MAVIGIIRELYRRVTTSLEKRKYNPNTRAEYLRKLGAQIGEGCYIIPTDLGAEPYLVKIGNHVAIAGDVKFVTHDGATWVFRDTVPDCQVFGPIVIEDNVILGQNAVLFPNITIGRNSVVGAGSVVITDIPPNSIVMGNPARPFGSLEKYREKCLERWAQQRPPDVVIEPGETWWTTKHFAENRRKLREHLLRLFKEQLG
jgi:acetyltransferase-like isoleucine patch superfamily enzyme